MNLFRNKRNHYYFSHKLKFHKRKTKLNSTQQQLQQTIDTNNKNERISKQHEEGQLRQ